MANNPRADKAWHGNYDARERSTDFAHTLSRIHWDTFNTLTFKNPIPRIKVAQGMAWQWCRVLSKICGIPYNEMLIALRGEFGEQRGRFHFHCLVGGTATRNITTFQHQSEHAWRLISGNAIVEARPYDRTLAGAEYLTKCLGANAYELGKYGLADSVTLSRSVARLMARTERNVERRFGKHTGKDGRVANG